MLGCRLLKMNLELDTPGELVGVGPAWGHELVYLRVAVLASELWRNRKMGIFGSYIDSS